MSDGHGASCKIHGRPGLLGFQAASGLNRRIDGGVYRRIDCIRYHTTPFHGYSPDGSHDLVANTRIHHVMLCVESEERRRKLDTSAKYIETIERNLF